MKKNADFKKVDTLVLNTFQDHFFSLFVKKKRLHFYINCIQALLCNIKLSLLKKYEFLKKSQKFLVVETVEATGIPFA